LHVIKDLFILQGSALIGVSICTFKLTTLLLVNIESCHFLTKTSKDFAP